jgi:hypothetical protein
MKRLTSRNYNPDIASGHAGSDQISAPSQETIQRQKTGDFGNIDWTPRDDLKMMQTLGT